MIKCFNQLLYVCNVKTEFKTIEITYAGPKSKNGFLIFPENTTIEISGAALKPSIQRCTESIGSMSNVYKD
ncbi:MAG: hypothetical protein V4613_11495 [Bacteroidota bacterium]